MVRQMAGPGFGVTICLRQDTGAKFWQPYPDGCERNKCWEEFWVAISGRNSTELLEVVKHLA